MKPEIKKLFLVTAIAAASISLTACGGGGSDKSDSNPVAGGAATDGSSAEGLVRIQKTGKAVPKEEADLGRTSGIWLSRYEWYRAGVPLDSEASGELSEYSSQISSIRYVSDEELIVDDCEIEAPVKMTLEQFKGSLNEQDEYVDAEPSELPCNGEMEYQFYERSDTDYRVDMVCRGELVGMSEMKQISAQTEYNQGALSFTADSGESLTTNGGVCGYMENLLPEERSPFPPSGTIEVVAPYEDTKIELLISTDSELKVGVYQIGAIGSGEELTADVSLDVASAEDEEGSPDDGGDFGDIGDDVEDDVDDIGDDVGDDVEELGDGFADRAGHEDVDFDFEGDNDSDDDDTDSEDEGEDGFEPEVSGGTLTIDSVDAYSASGSFDLILWDDSRIQGNFNLDMQ